MTIQRLIEYWDQYPNEQHLWLWSISYERLVSINYVTRRNGEWYVHMFYYNELASIDNFREKE